MPQQVVGKAQAENADVHLQPVVVTANPMGSALIDLVSPVSVLSGKELSFRQESTLGETLSKLPKHQKTGVKLEPVGLKRSLVLSNLIKVPLVIRSTISLG